MIYRHNEMTLLARALNQRGVGARFLGSVFARSLHPGEDSPGRLAHVFERVDGIEYEPRVRSRRTYAPRYRSRAAVANERLRLSFVTAMRRQWFLRCARRLSLD